MTKEFDLGKSMEHLESLEAYFQRPELDLEEAIAKHKEALKVAKEILAYLESAETVLEKLDPIQTAAEELAE